MDTTPEEGRPPGMRPQEHVSPEPVTGESAQARPVVTGYAVDRLLGAGGSGAVWLVRDGAGSPYALKVPGGAGNHGFEARREVNVLARLEHPHLVQLHGVAETDQGEGLLVGYAAGGSAAALVAARGPVAPGEAVSVLVGIAGALAYLHARGAAHGDISPANILFTAEGKPQLADFGQARLLGEPGTTAPGTPGFEAPEVSGGRPRQGQDSRRSTLGAAADVYALAAVGWFLLTGKPPPPVRDRPPLSILVPGVGRELPALLEAGLSEDPDLRPRAAELAAWAYRGARALPVDLVASAHPEVRPDLLTRRTGSAARAGGRNRPGREPGRGLRNRGRGTREVRLPHPPRRQHPPRRPRSAGRVVRIAGVVRIAAAVLVAAVLVLAGVAVAAPDLLRADGNRSDGRQDNANQADGNRSAGPAVKAPAETTPDSPPNGAADNGTDDGTVVRGDGQAAGSQDEAVGVLLARAGAADPAEAVPALAELRARAFSTADPGLLAHVDAPDSQALLADQEQVGRLVEDGQALRGLEMSASVRGSDPAPAGGSAVPGPGPQEVQLRVRLEVSAYERVDTAGAVLERAPARQQEVVLVLVRSSGAWKISTVLGTE